MTTRRTFIKTTAGLAGAAALGFSFKKAQPRLAFSTLGCPKWPLAQIIKTAAAEGYEAIEIRGIQGELFLPKCPEFSTPARIAETRKMVADHKVKICNLGASAALHDADQAKRQKNLDEAKRFIDLAQQLECPYIRVFPNDLPKDQDRDKTINLISEGLLELGQYAQKGKTTVLLESHGQVIWKDVLLRIMKQADHPNVGLIWDIFNMWSVTKEPPADVYKTLQKYIRHTHIKDGNIVDGKPAYTLVGKGVAPLKEAIDALKAGGYKGYYSFEWEKMWHPEIAEPEIAFADYPKAIRPLLE
ncbi:sugar phosphate isomerase/epimerase family protein [Larkinella insperata]|uniref:Sugar phosphate isomerase/epimerase family protein n=1 Tax=Larkinella insperata TaxID=332158 RepID=A0ABW3Q5K5_9BACT|nr:sugar phosphate isomerase/epimerase family protein [Larkinella insperata]